MRPLSQVDLSNPQPHLLPKTSLEHPIEFTKGPLEMNFANIKASNSSNLVDNTPANEPRFGVPSKGRRDYKKRWKEMRERLLREKQSQGLDEERHRNKPSTAKAIMVVTFQIREETTKKVMADTYDTVKFDDLKVAYAATRAHGTIRTALIEQHLRREFSHVIGNQRVTVKWQVQKITCVGTNWRNGGVRG